MSYTINNHLFLNTDILKDMVSQSVFYRGDESYINEVIDGYFNDLCDNDINLDSMLDDALDEISYDKQIDGFYVNANIIPSLDNSMLYCDSIDVKEEVLISGDTNFRSCDVPALTHSSGLRITYLAESLQDVWFEMQEEGCSASDMTMDNLDSRIGGIKYFDFFKEPYNGYVKDSSMATTHKIIANDLYNSTLKYNSRVLYIGGDGGSASGRRRDYVIDCGFFFEDEDFFSSVTKRKKRGHPGIDYIIDANFFKTHDPSKWDVINFNYVFTSNIIEAIYRWVKDSSVLVYGRGIVPQWTDSEIVMSSLYCEDMSQYPIDYSRASLYNYQILGKADPLGESVYVYTTHGVFKDEIGNSRGVCEEISTVDLMGILGMSSVNRSDNHSSYFFMQNKFDLGLLLSCAIPVDSVQYYYDNLVYYKVRDKIMYDEFDNVFAKNVFLNDCTISCVLVRKDMFDILVDPQQVLGFTSDDFVKVFVDCDLPLDSFYARRLVLEKSGMKIFSGSGIVFRREKNFDDGPCDWCALYDQYVRDVRAGSDDRVIGQLEVKHGTVSRKIKGIKKSGIGVDALSVINIVIDSCGFNPYVRRWVTGGTSILLRGHMFDKYLGKYKDSVGQYSVPVLRYNLCDDHYYDGEDLPDDLFNKVVKCTECQFYLALSDVHRENTLRVRAGMNFQCNLPYIDDLSDY